MKAKKAMQAKKRLAKMQMSARMAMRHTFAGKTTKTHNGYSKDDLVKNRRGKIVIKKYSVKAKQSPWIAAVVAARKALKLKGFVTIKKGSALHIKAKALYKK